MKKCFLLSLIFFLSAGIFLFAEEGTNQSSEEIIFTSEFINENQNSAQSTETKEIKREISRLLARSANVSTLKKNKEAIFSLAQDLDIETRIDLLKKYESDAETAKNENLRLGYGLGSFMQGDFWAFLPHALIDGVGSLAFYGGLTFLGIWFTIDFCTLFSLSITTDYSLQYYQYGAIISLAGGVVMLSSRLISIIHPYNYAKKFNLILNEALDLTDSIEKISVTPLLIPDEDFKTGMAISMKLK